MRTLTFPSAIICLIILCAGFGLDALHAQTDEEPNLAIDEENYLRANRRVNLGAFAEISGRVVFIGDGARSLADITLTVFRTPGGTVWDALVESASRQALTCQFVHDRIVLSEHYLLYGVPDDAALAGEALRQASEMYDATSEQWQTFLADPSLLLGSVPDPERAPPRCRLPRRYSVALTC